MKTCLMGAVVVLIAGLGTGTAVAQNVPRDKPQTGGEVDAAKVATVEQWSKRRGSKVIWSKDPQPLPKTHAADAASRVDAEQIEAIDQQSKERGHRQVWFRHPEQRSPAVAVNHTTAAGKAAAKKKAVPKSAKPGAAKTP